VTENKIRQLLNEIGISISEGQISNILTRDRHEELTAEKQTIFKAGIGQSGLNLKTGSQVALVV
jgi:hypothetical protein